jgi:hypothetical protein
VRVSCPSWSDLQQYSYFVEGGGLGCNAVQFGDSLAFRRNISPLSSGSKGKPRKIPADRARKLRSDYTEVLSGFPQSFQSNAGGSVLKQVTTTSFQIITNTFFINLLLIQSKF